MQIIFDAAHIYLYTSMDVQWNLFNPDTTGGIHFSPLKKGTLDLGLYDEILQVSFIESCPQLGCSSIGS